MTATNMCSNFSGFRCSPPLGFNETKFKSMGGTRRKLCILVEHGPFVDL